MSNVATIDLEKAEEIELDDFFNQIHSLMDSEENSRILPDDRLSARKWLLAILHYEKEVNFLKDEYKSALISKYIYPIDKKIEQLEKSQSYLRDGLLQFLKNADQKNVNFPDLGTVTRVDGTDKIIYPEDEAAFAEALRASGNDQFINVKYSLNKKAIGEFYKDHGEFPVSGLSTEKKSDSIRIRKAENEQ